MGTYKMRTGACYSCGVIVRKKCRNTRKIYCLDCGISAAARAMAAMASRDGPAYMMWLSSNGPKGRPKATKEV